MHCPLKKPGLLGLIGSGRSLSPYPNVGLPMALQKAARNSIGLTLQVELKGYRCEFDFHHTPGFVVSEMQKG